MPGALNNFIGAFTHSIGVPPDDAPKTLTLAYTLAAGVPQFYDFQEQAAMGLIDTIQSVYIDNDTVGKITIQVQGTNMYRIVAKPRTQGWYPIALPKDVAISVVSDQNASIALIFANVAICAGPWPTA